MKKILFVQKGRGRLHVPDEFTVRTVHPLLFTPNIEQVRPVHIDTVAVVALEVGHAEVATFLKLRTFTPAALKTNYFAGAKMSFIYGTLSIPDPWI